MSWYQSILSIIHLPHSYLTKLLSNSFSRKDSYSHFCAFGCLCYGSTFASHHTKFSPWATIIIFLGYPPGYKGYKLLDLSTNFIFIFGMLFFTNPFFSSKPLIHHNPNPPPTFFFYWVLPFLLINSSHSPTHLEFLPPVSTLSSSSMSCSTHVTKPPSYLCDYNYSLSLRLLFPFLIIYLMLLVMTNCLLHLKPLFLLFPLMLNLQLSPRLLQFLSGKRLCLFIACPSEKWHLVFVLSTSW